MSGDFFFNQMLQKPYLPINGDSSVYVLLEMKAAIDREYKRAPINLSVVLDRSGSMSGSPIEHCKNAVKYILNQLTENDLFNMVLFDQESETIIEPQRVVNKDLLKIKVDQIRTGGMTNLSSGLIEGCQNILEQQTTDYVNRVILLSDGKANVGLTNPGQLAELANEYNEAGCIISTLGVSAHFDEELLENIADGGKGNFYFIDSIEKIPNVFEKELTGILTVVGQNIKLRIKPNTGVSIKHIPGYSFKKGEEVYEISLGDIYEGEVKSILVELDVQSQLEGLYDLLNIEWSFIDISDGVKNCQYLYNVPVEFTSNVSKLMEKSNNKVEKQIEITKSAYALEKAIELFDQGKIEQGKNVLYKQARTLEILANQTNDSELKIESIALIENLVNFEYNKHKRKQLHQEKYRAMKRKRRE